MRRYNVDSFLLADENDRVHRFRDALKGPLGRLTAVSRQTGDWWQAVEHGGQANRDTVYASSLATPPDPPRNTT